MAMNKKVKKLWVDALRSGEYHQTDGALRRGNTFCCLGVLCNIHARLHPLIAAKQSWSGEYMGQSEFLPATVMRWAGLQTDYGDSVYIKENEAALTEHNDNGRTFKEIADAIESQL